MASQSAEEIQAKVIVLGGTGSGKSTFISNIVGHDVGISHSQTFTRTFNEHTIAINGRQVTLIEAPGSDDMSKLDQEKLKEWLNNCAHSTGAIYLYRINDPRETRTLRKEDQLFITLFKDSRIIPKVAIISTHWNNPHRTTEHKHQKYAEDHLWKPFMEKGALVDKLTPVTGISNTPFMENTINSNEAWGILSKVLDARTLQEGTVEVEHKQKKFRITWVKGILRVLK